MAVNFSARQEVEVKKPRRDYLFDEDDDNEDEDEDTQAGKYLVFLLGEESYGLEIRHVREIVKMQSITVVPDEPAHIRGIINLRGRVIPLTDVRTLFGIAAREYDNRTCIVVVNYQNAVMGYIVDRVVEVGRIPDDQIEMPNNLRKEGNNRYISGLGKSGDKVRLLLDVERIMGSCANNTTAETAKGGN